MVTESQVQQGRLGGREIKIKAEQHAMKAEKNRYRPVDCPFSPRK